MGLCSQRVPVVWCKVSDHVSLCKDWYMRGLRCTYGVKHWFTWLVTICIVVVLEFYVFGYFNLFVGVLWLRIVGFAWVPGFVLNYRFWFVDCS